jgi:hypothetical protein
MDETVSSSGPQSPSSVGKNSGGRQRVISSCLTCRRRKVKCDHAHPICGACTRGSHVCTWTDQAQAQTAGGRITKPSIGANGKITKNNDVQSRLDRLELLLEKAVAGQGTMSRNLVRSIADIEKRDYEARSTPSPHSQASVGQQGIAADNGDGVLLLDEGRAQFVSSLHFALLADEVRNITEPRLPLPQGLYWQCDNEVYADLASRSKTSKLCWAINQMKRRTKYHKIA